MASKPELNDPSQAPIAPITEQELRDFQQKLQEQVSSVTHYMELAKAQLLEDQVAFEAEKQLFLRAKESFQKRKAADEKVYYDSLLSYSSFLGESTSHSQYRRNSPNSAAINLNQVCECITLISLSYFWIIYSSILSTQISEFNFSHGFSVYPTLLHFLYRSLLFRGDVDVSVDEDGHIFFDFNPEEFDLVVDYLRTGTLPTRFTSPQSERIFFKLLRHFQLKCVFPF